MVIFLSKKIPIPQYRYYSQAYMKYCYCHMDSMRIFVEYICAVNITNNLNVQTNSNLYFDLSWINITLQAKQNNS